MKNTLTLIALYFLGNALFAQTETSGFPISIGYFSHTGYQPGVKVGTHFDLKNWETEAENKKGDFTKYKSYYVSPQIGFYSWINNHSSFLINADIGYKRIKSRKRNYSAWSVGLGYLNQSQITHWVVHLNDGSKDKVRNNRGWFLSTINYEFGKEINSKIGWYSKFSGGWKFSTERERTGVVFVELGIKFNLLLKK